MTSDTSDIAGPIPLTRAGLHVRPVGVLGVCFVLLGACECMAHAVPRFGVGRTLPGMKLTRHEKSNDHRGTLNLGPQRSRLRPRGGSPQDACGNRIFRVC